MSPHLFWTDWGKKMMQVYRAGNRRNLPHLSGIGLRQSARSDASALLTRKGYARADFLGFTGPISFGRAGTTSSRLSPECAESVPISQKGNGSSASLSLLTAILPPGATTSLSGPGSTGQPWSSISAISDSTTSKSILGSWHRVSYWVLSRFSSFRCRSNSSRCSWVMAGGTSNNSCKSGDLTLETLLATVASFLGPVVRGSRELFARGASAFLKLLQQTTHSQAEVGAVLYG